MTGRKLKKLFHFVSGSVYTVFDRNEFRNGVNLIDRGIGSIQFGIKKGKFTDDRFNLHCLTSNGVNILKAFC